MAAGLFRSVAQAAGLDWEAQSAGLAAFPGVPYAAEAVEALRERGVDISQGVSQPLSKSLALESDLLLTMTANHRDAILRKLPELKEKVSLLADFAGEASVDVEDPLGAGLESYRAVRDQIETYLTRALPRLRG